MQSEPTADHSTGNDSTSSDVATIDAGARSPQGRPCPACGGPIEPDDRFCPSCGAASEGPGDGGAGTDAEAGLRTTAVAAAESAERAGAHYFRCQGCGSEVSVDAGQRAYVCPFCDSSYVVEFSPDLSQRQRPEFVIGFAVTKEEAQRKFREWLAASGWHRPGDLARSAVVDRLRGVYLPFWTFAMRAESEWSARIGEHWYRTETYVTTGSDGKPTTATRQVQETEWWNLTGRHHRYYSGYLVSGSRGLPQAEALEIGPFNLPALRRYAPHYLAGWACEEYSVPPDEAFQRCQEEFYRREQGGVAAFLPGDAHADVHVHTTFTQITSDLCLLPVHCLTYRYGGQVYRFLVNGQTGKVTGQRPVSWRRTLAAIGIVLGLLAAAAAIGVLVRAVTR